MSNLKLSLVKTEMLIRKPVGEVFEAFVNPDITTKFWFTKSSGRLQPEAAVRWDWEMYGAWTNVNVLAVDLNRRISIEWGDPEHPTSVEFLFAPRSKNETQVTISNSGFEGSDEEIFDQAVDAMGGFTIVLCGAKAYLEHGIQLDLVADKSPDAHVGATRK